ncbi:MAG: hypothetical protein IT435_08660 [Phycisphaerales bacterium]|nr:hypothetical protein [Phycisphaerales bacterium]
MSKHVLKWGIAGLAIASGIAQASVTVSQGTSAPTYSTTLNFDEVGGPTGSVPSGSWSSIGVSSFIGGAGDAFVGQFNTNPGWGWLGTGNAVYGAWGLFMNFSNDLTEFSAQYWDNSGPATMMGGGALVVALDNGAEVGSLFITDPAFGGAGDEWINIQTSDGSTFDEVRMLGFGFFPEAYADNLSWNAVPAPSAAGLAVIGLIISARRRAR